MQKNIKVGVIENKGPNSLRNFLCIIKNSNCKSLEIAVAFITKEGVDAIGPLLSSVAKRCKVRILTGIYQSFTQPSALKELNKISRQTNGNLELRISKNKRFHWKAYFLIKKTNADVVIGSSNLTSDGLGAEGEINLQLNLGTNSSSFKNIYRSFVNEWENNSCSCTEKEIAAYQKKWNQSKSLVIFNSLSPSQFFKPLSSKSAPVIGSIMKKDYWVVCFTGHLKKQSVEALRSANNWDQKGLLYFGNANSYKNGDFAILIDENCKSKPIQTIEITDVVMLPKTTPDGKRFASYKILNKTPRRQLTLKLKKKIKECGVIKKYSDLSSMEKITESKFKQFVKLLT
jgi:HKD family nuclease